MKTVNMSEYPKQIDAERKAGKVCKICGFTDIEHDFEAVKTCEAIRPQQRVIEKK